MFVRALGALEFGSNEVIAQQELGAIDRHGVWSGRSVDQPPVDVTHFSSRSGFGFSVQMHMGIGIGQKCRGTVDIVAQQIDHLGS
jgi:hypothetical protein